MATALGMSIIYGPYSVFKPGGELFNSAQNVIYGSFSRLAWALALAWVVYACQHKMGGQLLYCFSFLCWFEWFFRLRKIQGFHNKITEAKACDYFYLKSSCFSVSFLRDILVRVICTKISSFLLYVISTTLCKSFNSKILFVLIFKVITFALSLLINVQE